MPRHAEPEARQPFAVAGGDPTRHLLDDPA